MREQKINREKMTKSAIILPSVKLLLNPAFTNDVLNTAATYGSLK